MAAAAAQKRQTFLRRAVALLQPFTGCARDHSGASVSTSTLGWLATRGDKHWQPVTVHETRRGVERDANQKRAGLLRDRLAKSLSCPRQVRGLGLLDAPQRRCFTSRNPQPRPGTAAERHENSAYQYALSSLALFSIRFPCPPNVWCMETWQIVNARYRRRQPAKGRRVLHQRGRAWCLASSSSATRSSPPHGTAGGSIDVTVPPPPPGHRPLEAAGRIESPQHAAPITSASSDHLNSSISRKRTSSSSVCCLSMLVLSVEGG